MLDLLEHIKSSKYYVISKQSIGNSADVVENFKVPKVLGGPHFNINMIRFKFNSFSSKASGNRDLYFLNSDTSHGAYHFKNSFFSRQKK